MLELKKRTIHIPKNEINREVERNIEVCCFDRVDIGKEINIYSVTTADDHVLHNLMAVLDKNGINYLAMQ